MFTPPNILKTAFGSNTGHGLFVGWVEHPDIFCWVSLLNPIYLQAILVLSAKPTIIANLQFRLVRVGLDYKQKDNSLLVLLGNENFCQVENKSLFPERMDVFFYQYINTPSRQHSNTAIYKINWPPQFYLILGDNSLNQKLKFDTELHFLYHLTYL
jgi:hypothetical protein